MSFMFASGPCLVCRKLFTFNPERVPSFKGEPICRACMEEVNRKRAELGHEPHPILPGAYDQEEVGG